VANKAIALQSLTPDGGLSKGRNGMLNSEIDTNE
jgi:hypothetical protein